MPNINKLLAAVIFPKRAESGEESSCSTIVRTVQLVFDYRITVTVAKLKAVITAFPAENCFPFFVCSVHYGFSKIFKEKKHILN